MLAWGEEPGAGSRALVLIKPGQRGHWEKGEGFPGGPWLILDPELEEERVEMEMRLPSHDSSVPLNSTSVH